jgi:S-adenosylmethionine:tRNA-ribosyltransferase-isomerase (queuine synthetase)
MLVSAFAGYDLIMEAYREAVELRYQVLLVRRFDVYLLRTTADHK